MAFQILALNTEKAHNLKEKALEVIRMYRGLVREEPEAGEDDYAFQFEAPHFITLGLLYEENKRFAGGAFAPILRRVDKFLKGHFPRTLKDREERALMVREADAALGQVVAKLKKRGINHPYVKNFVLARTTPLTRQRKTLSELRADVQEAPRGHRGLRRRQGPLRGHPALGHHGGATGGIEEAAMARPKKLEAGEIAERLKSLAGWELKGGKLHRELTFKDFVEAFRFMTGAAFEAERLQHHPEWFNVYNRVTVDLVTHDAQGITALDFDLAQRMQQLAEPAR